MTGNPPKIGTALNKESFFASVASSGDGNKKNIENSSSYSAGIIPYILLSLLVAIPLSSACQSSHDGVVGAMP